uniref:Uncharacterized protein n=1 Tax=Anguilla anguilla TaxID=7936 RepID=A0A0E9QMF8_ANGAN
MWSIVTSGDWGIFQLCYSIFSI